MDAVNSDAKLLTPSTGNTSYHVRDPSDFIQTITSLVVSPQDITATSDALTVFIHIFVNKALDILGQKFGKVIMSILHLVLTLTHFMFSGWFYEQKNGASIGSTPSPVS